MPCRWGKTWFYVKMRNTTFLVIIALFANAAVETAAAQPSKLGKLKTTTTTTTPILPAETTVTAQPPTTEQLTATPYGITSSTRNDKTIITAKSPVVTVPLGASSCRDNPQKERVRIDKWFSNCINRESKDTKDAVQNTTRSPAFKNRGVKQTRDSKIKPNSTLGKANPGDKTREVEKRGVSNMLRSTLKRTIVNVYTELSKMVMRYPPAHTMFKRSRKLVSNMSNRGKHLLSLMTDSETSENGEERYDYEQLSNNDVKRLVYNIEHHATITLQDKITTPGGLANLTAEDISILPTDIFSAMTNKTLTEINSAIGENANGITTLLCEQLFDIASSPWILKAALAGGVECLSNINKKSIQGSNAKVLMTQLLDIEPPSAWDGSTVIGVLRSLGDAVTVQHIEAISDQALANSLTSISSIKLPRKSQRLAVLGRITSKYRTPTEWPQIIVDDFGRLLEDMDVQKISLIRQVYVLNLADRLTSAEIERDTTRIALFHSIKNAIKKNARSSTKAFLINVLPWMKCDTEFLQNIQLNHMGEVLQVSSQSQLSPAEKHILANRLIEFPTFASNETDVTEKALTIAYLIDGFSQQYIESLPTPTVEQIKYQLISNNKTIHSIAKARLVAQQHPTLNKSSDNDIRFLNGLDTWQINNLTISTLVDWLPTIQNMHIPAYLARAVTQKIGLNVIKSGNITCNDALNKLGKLAMYLDTDVIESSKLVPFEIYRSCNLSLEHIDVTRGQAYAIMENIREMVGVSFGEDIFLTANVVKRLAKLNKGLAAEDISNIPLNSELLTIIEILSEYENDLDSSQIEAIVDKIRDYFDLRNRNQVDEANIITMLQIGRFLQYLNPDFELPKFPRRLRTTICQQIGKSDLGKISSGKRQQLLRFALQNVVVPSATGDDDIVDITNASKLDSDVLMDLGHLKCGLTSDLIEKLTSEAIDTHLEDLTTCPFKATEAKMLAKKALDYNINRLKQPEQLATLGPLLQYLDDEEFELIEDEQLESLSEYLVKVTKKREQLIKSMENNGFIREWTSTDKEEDMNLRKRLFQKIHKALRNTIGKDNCYSMLRMGTEAAHISDITLLDISSCLEDIGNLPSWEPGPARLMFESVVRTMFGKEVNPETASFFDPEFIRQVAGLIKGLHPNEISSLNLQPDVFAVLGEFDGFTAEQLKRGFKCWKHSHQNPLDLHHQDFANIGIFACGASPDYIQHHLSQTGMIKRYSYLLGRLSSCSPEQLQAYAKKYLEQTGSSASNLKLHDVINAGALIGGFTRNQLQIMTRRQIRVIEPDVISTMPADKITDFTTEQLGSLTDNQKNAITSMQRSFMTEEQVAAITPFDGHNSGCTVFITGCTQLVIVLSAIRQLLVIINQ